MNDKKPAKFFNKYETTYYDFFNLRFETLADVTNAFSEAIGREKAIDIVEKFSEEKSIEMIKKIVSQNPITNFNDFKKLFLSQMKSEFMNNAVTFTIKENTENKLEFKITECLWATAHKKMGETELGFCAFCKPDYAMAKTYHPKIKLTRTKTLMQGDEFCNHTYTWEDE
jgi:hypothetical protein